VRIAPLLDRHEERIALAMVLVYVVVFGSLSLIRHWAFHSTALDLGVFDHCSGIPFTAASCRVFA